ncbi:hypothetical protein [Microvirga sp. VF16]|uniref:hypothetical protein n=1 Tax=Microvirga sp. VF16 TaxID=2807101 RepID=UPI00193EB3F4|nr:hypothetical protein [Microvirga sp. VF16]QRM34828.1 hypothetical protein JO965_41955 [Microvirga sp. VF16]
MINSPESNRPLDPTIAEINQTLSEMLARNEALYAMLEELNLKPPFDRSDFEWTREEISTLNTRLQAASDPDSLAGLVVNHATLLGGKYLRLVDCIEAEISRQAPERAKALKEWLAGIQQHDSAVEINSFH